MTSDGKGGFPEGVEVKEEKIGAKPIERSAANQVKVDTVKQFLDCIIKEDEVDAFFLENMELAKKLGYRLQADPKVLLAQIEKQAGS